MEAGVEAFWTRIVDDPNTLLPGVLAAHLGIQPHRVKSTTLFCVVTKWRCLLAARTMRPWRPRLEKTNRGARQFEIGVRGWVEQVVQSVRVHDEAKTWLILTNCSNAFSTVKQTAAIAEAAIFVSTLTQFVDRSAPVFFQMESGERRETDCSSVVQQGDAVRSASFCMPLLPVLRRTRVEFKPRGAEAFVYLDQHRNGNHTRYYGSCALPPE